MDTTRDVHGIMDAEQYDRVIGGIVPSQPMLLSTIVDYLPPAPQSILELGCGTGILTGMIAEVCPDAEITGIDLSPGMLLKAAEKPELGGVRFLAQDLRDPWPAGHYDAIVSSLCLHHVPREDRVMVARRAARALAPFGRFICGDIFRAGNDWEEAVQREIWRKGMRRGNVPDQIIQGMLVQRERNMPAFTTAAGFRDILVNSGFNRAMVPFTSGFVGLVVGFACGAGGEGEIGRSPGTDVCRP